MTSYRIDKHPILPTDQGVRAVHYFFWEGTPLSARPGEMIAALFAAGILPSAIIPGRRTTGPILRQRGQCAQCLVLAAMARPSKRE